MEARATGAEREGRGDALLAGHPHAASPEPQRRQVYGQRCPRRTPTPGREEQEPRALLVGVAEQSAVRVRPMVGLQFVHARTLEPTTPPCLTNPGNYN